MVSSTCTRPGCGSRNRVGDCGASALGGGSRVLESHRLSYFVVVNERGPF